MTDTAPAVPTARTIGVVLLVAGLVGEAAAFILAVEKYWLLTNPFYTPSCNLGAVLSCGPVMSSDQSAAFGFPNPYLGIAGFAVIAATGAAILGGAKLPTWYRAGLLAGATLGAAFVGWLIVQSLFVIKALCPYCMAVWAATLTTLWYVLLTTAIGLRPRLSPPAQAVLDRAAGSHSAVLTGGLTLLAVLIAATTVTTLA